MVDGNLPPQNWPKHALGELINVVNNAKQARKYLFIWDKQGNVGTFMQYKMSLAPLGPEIVKMALQRQSAEDIGEFIRAYFVNCMRNGETLGLDLDTSVPDFASYNKEGTFDAALFFNYEEFAKDEKYLPFVRESENHGIGGLNHGHYNRSDDFGMVMRSGVTEDETIQEQIAKIPGFYENFQHVIIE